MAKKKGKKKLMANFLIEISLPDELFNRMDIEDRKRLYELNRLDIRWKAFGKSVFVFHLGDVNKVNSVLSKYNYTIVYPDRKELNMYGLSYSGQSLNITRNGNDFVITQRFPDGKIETHVVPEKRVWRVYYAIERYFQKHPEKEKAKARDIWNVLVREFGIDWFIDRADKFHPNSFFGARKTYHTFYYYPIKILQHIGKIKYTKRGIIYNPLKGDKDGEGDKETTK